MSFVEYIADEKYKLLANALVAAIGFFVALFANSSVDDWKERRSFATILSAVRAEANSNEVAFRESFLRLYKDGLVLREFGTTAVSQALANPLFVKHASAIQLEALAQYLRNISLANTYRAKAETIRFSESYFTKSNERSIKYWEPMLVDAWTTNLSECQKSIGTVQSLS
jgi:hypothetical protein